MKRILLTAALTTLLLSACSPKTEESAASIAAADTPVPAGLLSMNYMNAASALAADDLEKAKAALAELAKETTGELQTRSQAAAGSADIAAMRESFKALSELATRMELPAEYAVAFCPMYKGGSRWVQKKETLANPYFGKSMLTCGNFVN